MHLENLRESLVLTQGTPGESWAGMSRSRLALAKQRQWVWAFTVLKEWGWKKVPAHGRFNSPAGAKGGGEVIGLLISLSRCGAKGERGRGLKEISNYTSKMRPDSSTIGYEENKKYHAKIILK